MVEISVIDPHENDVDCNGSSVGCKESDVDGSRRDVNGKESNVDGGSHDTSDVTQSIFQLATLARKKFAQHYQSGRKSIFRPETLLEKPESNKGDETDILEDDKIQLLDSLHMEHGRLTNHEIAFILAIRAITESSTHIFRTNFPFVTAPTSALRSPAALPICCVESSPTFSLNSRFLMNQQAPEQKTHHEQPGMTR